MKTKYAIDELSFKEKNKLYHQEITEELVAVKVWLWAILAIVIIFDYILELAVKPLFSQINRSSLYSAEIPTIVIAILVSMASNLPCLKKLSGTNFTFVKVVLTYFAGILLGIYLLLVQLERVETAIKSQQEDKWIQAHITISYSIYITIIVNLTCPTWFLKFFIPSCYYLGIILAYCKTQHPQLVWIVIRNITSFIYVLILNVIASKIKWHIFLKNLEIVRCNQMYKLILDKNPSSLAILDGEGKVVYSNDEFKRNSELVSNHDFFENVTQLRLRSFPGMSRSPECLVSISINNEEAKNLLNTDRKPSHEIKNSDASYQYFETLTSMLKFYQGCLNKRKIEYEEQIVFDGKLTYGVNRENVLSLEVIIKSLLHTKKIMLIINDTTERDSIVAQENNNDYKDQLLASISHELRTPLNGNLGLLQAAINDPTIPEAAKNNLLFPAFRSGRLLSHLMNDLLDYSHLLTDKLVLCYESRSLKETFEYCYQLLEDAFASKDLTFNITLDERLPALFRTDHNRLTQILLNLLTNGLKFTMAGNVSIDVEFVDDSFAVIQVKDTGIGIKEEVIQKLFDEDAVPQTRLSISGSGSGKESYSKGVGLGLKVSGRLAKMLGHPDHRGIIVSSVPNIGSCFSFTVLHILNDCGTTPTTSERIIAYKTISIPEIPAEFMDPLDHTPSRAMESYAKQKWTFYKKKSTQTSEISSSSHLIQRQFYVLIVDDDQFNILALESQLTQLGLLVDSVNNGMQALERVKLQGHVYKLIFMDCQMPVMDGYEASRRLTQEMEQGIIPKIPIIGCTAFNDKDRIEECLKCGMKQVINKPVMRNNLEKVIKKYIKFPRIHKNISK